MNSNTHLINKMYSSIFGFEICHIKLNNNGGYHMQGVKGTVHTKIKNTLFLLPVVLFILLDCFCMSC